MTSPSETAGAMREELGRDSAQLRGTVEDRARQEAGTGKDKAVGIAGSASDALGKAAEELRNNPEAPDWMASGLQQVARQIDRLAGELEGRSVEDLTREASRLARENPGTFLVAAAAAGFAAARLLRAGAEHEHHAQGSQQETGGEGAVWPADENVGPADGGEGFTPAYAPEGGTIR